jgi:hypothetical protein
MFINSIASGHAHDQIAASVEAALSFMLGLGEGMEVYQRQL